jgi:hypothetical protein
MYEQTIITEATAASTEVVDALNYKPLEARAQLCVTGNIQSGETITIKQPNAAESAYYAVTYDGDDVVLSVDFTRIDCPVGKFQVAKPLTANAVGVKLVWG